MACTWAHQEAAMGPAAGYFFFAAAYFVFFPAFLLSLHTPHCVRSPRTVPGVQCLESSFWNVFSIECVLYTNVSRHCLVPTVS
jgi:hypothetical protein